jgi:hypothetical protein
MFECEMYSRQIVKHVCPQRDVYPSPVQFVFSTLFLTFSTGLIPTDGMYYIIFHFTNKSVCVQGVFKKVGLANSSLFCVIAPVPLSSDKNHEYFHKIQFIVVILSIIEFLSSKGCPRY